MLARRVVGALDRHTVVGLLSGLPGTDVGAAPPVEPAEPGDERVDVLARVLQLQYRHWRGQEIDRLCADLVTALDSWEIEWEAFHRDLRRLLEDR